MSGTMYLMYTVIRNMVEVMAKFLNVENEWDVVVACLEVMWPCCLIDEDEVAATINFKDCTSSWFYWYSK